uniref:Uncharacterized protein n=1 Tax=viral metagenome TaxID=1070528 RepID=A0A6H1Z8D3_9ZZZZ
MIYSLFQWWQPPYWLWRTLWRVQICRDAMLAGMAWRMGG